MPLPPIGGPPPSGPPPPSGLSQAIDLRMSSWPVRDQGQRGTCVAFAVTACREHLAARGSARSDLSEQFLYWAIKKYDPWPHQDGTLVQFAQDALQQDGICTQGLWPYNGLFNPTNSTPPDVSHQTPNHPSLPAKSDAVAWQHKATFYSVGSGSGHASALLNLLTTVGRPVAITLPVFRDPLAPPPVYDNWNTPSALLYGRILNPPPTSVAYGGHAVCTTGYIPDQNESMGGWFVFRNSWGRAWASSAPTAGSLSPEQGYGYVSATYVDRFLWEMGSL